MVTNHLKLQIEGNSLFHLMVYRIFEFMKIFVLIIDSIFLSFLTDSLNLKYFLLVSNIAKRSTVFIDLHKASCKIYLLLLGSTVIGLFPGQCTKIMFSLA